MKRLAAIALLLPFAAFAATPASPSSTTASAVDTADGAAQLDALQAQMRELATEMAALSVKLGNQASATALRYLADNHRGMLGIAISPDKQGMHVDAVTPGGPAERAGLMAGDVITAVDGKSLAQGDLAWLEELSDLQPGRAVELTIARNGKTLRLKATPERFGAGDWQTIALEAQRAARQATSLVTSPEFQQQIRQEISDALRDASSATRSAIKARKASGAWNITAPWWGLNLASLNPDLGRYFGTAQGALVLSRDATRYPALEPGDVITRVGGRPVTGPEDAMRAFRDAPEDKPVTVTVRRHDKTLDLAFKTPPRWMVLPPPPPPAPPAPPPPAAPASISPPVSPPAPAAPPPPPPPHDHVT